MSFIPWIAAADNHGSLGCPVAQKKLLDFCATWKPKHRIHLGDNWDFSPLRRGASQEEKADGIAEDYQAGMDFLDAYKPNFLTLGNHDDRIWLNSTHAPDGILRERCQELARASEAAFKKRKIAFVPYHVKNYLRMPEGGPLLIHGFRATMHPARSHFENWGEVIHGHTHRPDAYHARHIFGSQSFSVGCMADMDRMTYADRTTGKLAWRQGFLYGLINSKTGRWQAWHAINENGTWISPQGVL